MKHTSQPHSKQKNAQRTQRGQGLAEYGIILLVVAAVLVATINLLEPAIADLFEEFATDAPLSPPSLMGYTPPPTYTPSPTNTPGPSPTNTPLPTNTPRPSKTPTATDTPPPTVTNTPTATNTPVPSATATSTTLPTITSQPTEPPPTDPPPTDPPPTDPPPTEPPPTQPPPTQPPPPSNPEMHIVDLDASEELSCAWIFCRWDVQLSVRVRSGSSNVRGASVTANWDGSPESCSSPTSRQGYCTITRSYSISIPDSVTVSFASSNAVTHSSYDYRPALNSDPDNDSNGTTITIRR